MIQQIVTGLQAVDQAVKGLEIPLLQPIVGNNSASFQLAKAADARTRREVASFTYKRSACMTHDCVACPFARDNGSC